MKIRIGIMFQLLALVPSFVTAQISGIEVRDMGGSFENNQYIVSADIHYEFSDETQKALEQGVALEFDVTFRMREKRPWLWDTLIMEKKLTYRIEHQPLSKQYLVTEIVNGKHHQFRTLVSALGFISNVEAIPLINRNMLMDERDYIIQVRSRLNIQSLPAPLRPLVYFSPQWRLSSAWQNLEVRL